MDKRKEIIALLVLVLVALIWGSAFVAQTLGARDTDPFTFTAFRNWVALIFLVPFIPISDKLQAKNKTSRKPQNKEEGKLLLKAILACGSPLFIGSMVQQIAIAHTTTAKAGFITAMYVIIVPLLSVLIGQKVQLKIWFCLIPSLAGLYLLCMKGSFQLGFGDSLLLFSALVYAVQIMSTNYFADKVDPIRMACGEFLLSALLSTIFMFILEKPTMTALMAALPSILYAGCLSSGIGFTLQTITQEHLNPTLASITMSMESVFSALAGWLVLGQTLSLRGLIGCGLMFSAIILSQIPMPWEGRKSFGGLPDHPVQEVKKAAPSPTNVELVK